MNKAYFQPPVERTVLTLVPKKGDLSHLKNWRPVALLYTEYKVLSRVLSNRLKPYIGLLVHMDLLYPRSDHNGQFIFNERCIRCVQSV